jgi:putative addiction module CopG family antidote
VRGRRGRGHGHLVVQEMAKRDGLEGGVSRWYLRGTQMRHVDLSEEVVRLAEAQVAAGRAKSIEDVVRAGVDALVLRTQERYDEKLAKLREAIDEGDASGVFEGDPFAEVRSRHGLPAAPR